MARKSTPAMRRVRPRRAPAPPALVQIGIAVPDADAAARISMALLEQHLCACAQTVGPVTSRYRWQGRVETATEFLLLVKTRRALYPAVETAVRALHPYEVPEIIALPVQDAEKQYAAWVVESTTTPSSRARPRARAARSRRPRS